jgi:hypothetical protein
MKDWRKLPATLIAMFVLAVGDAVFSLCYNMTRSIDHFSARYNLASHGVWIATDVLAIVGLFELARRTSGREAAGFRLAALGTLLGIANGVVWAWWFAVGTHHDFETVAKIQQWSYFVVRLLPMVGVIVAASLHHRRAAIAGVVVVLVTNPIPSAGRVLYGWVGGYRAELMLMEALVLVSMFALVAIAAVVARPAESAPPAGDATYGFRTISSGLWLRVIAACGVAGLTLMLVLGKAGEGSVGVFKLATMSGAILGAVSLAMISVGALRSIGGDVPTWPLLVGAIATLWALGVALAQLPETYSVLYGSDDFGSAGRDAAEALSVVAPLVAIAGIAAFARAISGFAARRGLEDLRAEAQGKGLGFVTLMLAGVGLQQWLLPGARSESSFAMMLLAAAGCSLWATVLMARLCTLAADSLSTRPELPIATLRS